MNTTSKSAWLILTSFALLAMGCASSLDIPPENQERIRSYWTLYLKSDPGWPEARNEWLSMGEDEAQGLVNLLVQEVQRNAIKTVYRPSGLPEPAWKKPVEELITIGNRSVPSLLEALRILKDETTVYPCQFALKEIADLSVITAEFQRGHQNLNIDFQTRLVKVMIMMNTEESVGKVLTVVSGSYDWRVRATAVSELSKYEGPMMGEVKRALERALDDDDAFIVKTAKKALKELNR